MSHSILHEELFHSADLDIKDGLYDAAVQKLEQIIQEDPSFGKAYNHLGWLHETKFKNFDDAERFYQLSIKYAPHYSPGYTNYAVLLSTLKKFDELQSLLENAMNVPGIDKATLHNEYGIMYELMGEFQKAIDAYKECAKTTLNNNTIKTAKESIERCKTKMDL